MTCRWPRSSPLATRRPSRTPAPPWQPLKVYYNQTFSKARVEAFHQALTALGEESPYAEWLESWTRPDRAVTTCVECSAWFDRRDAALVAHATQVDP
jgi:mycothiol S-conjugate amidase